MDDRRIAAIPLIACFAIFVVAGLMYTARAIWKWPSAQGDTYLVVERAAVIAAALVNVMGFVLLEGILRTSGDALIGRLALPVYLIATAVLVVAEGSFMSRTGTMSGQIILYIVLAFLVQAAFGASLLRTGLVPAWVGWVTILWNIAWLVILPIASPKDIYYPVLHHVAPLLIGIVLLSK